MSGLAVVLSGHGATVTGSDQRESDTTRRLRDLGIKVEIGHRRENLPDVDLVVVSAAVPTDNPEVVAAAERRVPVIPRAEMLGRLMSSYKHRIAVAGTHGKTTTTSMTALVLIEAGLDPTVLVGGDLDEINGNARLGRSDVVVAEACEAFSSFLHLRPSVAVITNVDADHLEHHGSLENIKDAFRRFLGQVDRGGCVIACGDDGQTRNTLSSLGEAQFRLVTYGAGEDVDLRAVDIDVDSPRASFSCCYRGEHLGRMSLGAPGMQNVLNALAAAAVGIEQGVDFAAVQRALARYTGAARRFEILGEAAGVMVVDDYAHHPTEIAATLAAARRGWRRRVVAVFQPHLYSRTRFLLNSFAESLADADRVIVTDIYAAREKPIDGVSAEQIVEAVNSNGLKRAEYIADKTQVAAHVLPDLRADDMVIVMGAGDIRVVGEQILGELSGRPVGARRPEGTVK